MESEMTGWINPQLGGEVRAMLRGGMITADEADFLHRYFERQ